jgi:hypothetical protein
MAGKILITPNTGSTTADPTIVFQGSGTTTEITQRMTSLGTLQIEGSAGGVLASFVNSSNAAVSKLQVNGTIQATSIEFPTVASTTTSRILYAGMASNDFLSITVGGTAVDQGYAEIATGDNGTEPIYVRQYNNSTITRTLTLLDASGNTTFPGTISATNITGTNTGDQSFFDSFTTGVASPGPQTFPSQQVRAFDAISSTDFPGNYFAGLTVTGLGGVRSGQLGMNWNSEELAPTGIYFRTNDDTGTVSAWSPWTRILTTADAASGSITLGTTSVSIGSSISSAAGFNAATATKLAAPTTINGVAFDGSAPINIGTPSPYYDIHNFINGKPLVNEILVRVIAVRAFALAANCAGSYAFCTTPATTSFQLSLLKNGAEFGTITFGIAATTGTFSSPAATFNVSDQFAIRCKTGTQDSTLSDIAISLLGTA